MTFISSVLATLLAATPGVATAADEAVTWEPARLSLEINWTGRADQYHEGEVVMTNQTEGPGLIFYCLAEELQAVVSTEPVDFIESVEGPGGKARLAYVRMYQNGDMVHATKWVYIAQKHLIRARDHTSKAKLYNAVLRGDTIRLQWTGADEVEFTPPPVNDVFRDFGAECGLGRNRDRGDD